MDCLEIHYEMHTKKKGGPWYLKKPKDFTCNITVYSFPTVPNKTKGAGRNAGPFGTMYFRKTPASPCTFVITHTSNFVNGRILEKTAAVSF